MKRNLLCIAAALSASLVQPAMGDPLDWPGLYDTDILPELHVRLRQSDWNTILVDETFDIEVPAYFWATNSTEPEILVSIRRKSATPINGKVSFKIDINEFDDFPEFGGAEEWHGVKKLSLENGDDVDLVSEGLAWFIHRLAQEQGIYPVYHDTGKANWATLTVHLTEGCMVEPCGEFDLGEVVTTLEPLIYVNQEQPDKQFLKNRELWVSGETWLYKQDEHALPPEVKEAGCDPEQDDSPATVALDCAPFIPGSGATTKGKGGNNGPAACDLVLVDQLVDMDVLLAQGAADAVAGNPDGVFTHVKNFYAVDFSTGGDCAGLPDKEFDDAARQKRLHFTWDLDEAIANVNQNVYGKVRKHRGQTELRQNGYEKQLLVDSGDLIFRTTYNTNLLVMTEPKFILAVQNFLDYSLQLIGPALVADPNSKISNPAGHFNGLKNYLVNRAAVIREQVCQDDPELPGCYASP